MTLVEFEREVVTVAMASPICDIPIIWRLRPSSINMRVNITSGGFIDIFFNEQTGTMSFALIRANQRVFGADNTGGWHLHPFAQPDQHLPLSVPLSLAEFVAMVEQL